MTQAPDARLVRVVIESPYGSTAEGLRADRPTVERNIGYLRAAVLDCLRQGEAPFGSHGFYPRFLDDADPGERALGIRAGFAWGACAERVIVYADHGITPGMRQGIARARAAGQVVEYRGIGGRG